MLNQDLIKQFKHIKDGTLTGVLQLQDEGRLIRFYFEEGSLLLLAKTKRSSLLSSLLSIIRLMMRWVSTLRRSTMTHRRQ